MARNSFRASDEGISLIKKTLKIKKYNQTYLAGLVGCTRQTIWNLLKGNPIDAEFFLVVCQHLDLPANDLIQKEDNYDIQEKIIIDKLVDNVRKKVKSWIEQRCGCINVLTMTQPINLNDIYTDVDLLEKIECRRRLNLKDLADIYPQEELEQFGFWNRKERRIDGLEALESLKKLVIFGSPGSGKTTFLKRIATQCISGEFHPELVPVYIVLERFADAKEPNLLTYIANQLAENQVDDSENVAKQLLYEGRCLILLDGLDEVTSTGGNRTVHEIRRFSELYYTNYCVLTCRLAAKEFKIENFNEAQISCFDDLQIALFINKWFERKKVHSSNKIIRYLQANPRVKELTNNPLLLTLFCLGIEETSNYSGSRSELYKEGLNVLLKRWDASKGIERDQIYRKLTPDRKEDLLGQLAHITFEEKKIFFTIDDATNHISSFICKLSNINLKDEQLNIDSLAVLKSVELQHGLVTARSQSYYSFSHLTFQEYFAARSIVRNCSPTEMNDKLLLRLTQQISDRRWREVFLLVAEMLPDATCFFQIMKKKIDSLITQDKLLQNFITWVYQKAQTVETPYKSSANRAFYADRIFYIFCSPLPQTTRAVEIARKLDSDFDLALEHTRNFALDLDLDLAQDLDLDLELLKVLIRATSLNNTVARKRALALARALDSALGRALECLVNNSAHASAQAQALNLLVQDDFDATFDTVLTSEHNFISQLQILKGQLPDPDLSIQRYDEWWNEHGNTWVNDFRTMMVQFRDIGHEWFFNTQQMALLDQYIEANVLLIDCLNLDCSIEPAIRESLEDSLIIPPKDEFVIQEVCL